MTRKKISKNFYQDEFDCRCGNCEEIPVSKSLLEKCELVRGHFGKPVVVTNGTRCVRHNALVGGVKSSYHLPHIGNELSIEECVALDMKVLGIAPYEVFRFLNDKFPDTLGLGEYGSWVHMDTRQKRARW